MEPVLTFPFDKAEHLEETGPRHMDHQGLLAGEGGLEPHQAVQQGQRARQLRGEEAEIKLRLAAQRKGQSHEIFQYPGFFCKSSLQMKSR